MKMNNSGFLWLHIPVLLLKIVRILIKKPSGQPKSIQLELWGRGIKVSADPEIGRVRLDIITLPMLSIGANKITDEDCQSRLDLGEIEGPLPDDIAPSYSDNSMPKQAVPLVRRNRKISTAHWDIINSPFFVEG